MSSAIPTLGGIVRLQNNEPSVSTMFLSDLTVIDHAYIDNFGNLIGGSIHPTFIVSGTPDPVEKVVVDFSAVKKQIKAHIDRHVNEMDNNGFDHKVWIIKGYSNCKVVSSHQSSLVEIDTPTVRITVPYDAVRIIDGVGVQYEINGTAIPSLNDLGVVLAKYVQDELAALHPKINVKVSCTATEHFHLPTRYGSYASFRYSHGLKDSTSYGCKNVAHGHRSFIQATAADYRSDTSTIRDIVQDIAREFDKSIFLRSENLIQPGADESIAIEYTTERRGYFRMGIKSTSTQRVIVLSTETTVEFIAQTIADLYTDDLRKANVGSIYVSEGLSKGAMVSVQD